MKTWHDLFAYSVNSVEASAGQRSIQPAPLVLLKAMAAQAQAQAQPFASLTDDILDDILQRLPSSASLVRAALVSKRWGGIVSNPDFLSRFRKLHPSSPLLGFFFSDRPFGLPAFRLSGPVRSDSDLKAAARGGDLLLTGLEQDPGWRLRDSRNGRLLLSRDGNSFSIYDPISRRRVLICDRPRDAPVDYFSDCLLDDGSASFRVVSVQQHRGRIRAVEYNSGTLEWYFHPWECPWVDNVNKLESWGLKAMHAAGLIFWKYDYVLSVVLDSSTMRFSMCPIPVAIYQPSRYAIGEIEDGKGCFVYLDGLDNPNSEVRLKVWLLNRDGGTIRWVFNKEILVSELLGADTRVRQVRMVNNGLALLSMDDRYDQFVIDLQKLSLQSEFDFRGGRVYPYQMPWPPVGLATVSKGSTPTEGACPEKLSSSGDVLLDHHHQKDQRPTSMSHTLRDSSLLAAALEFVQLGQGNVQLAMDLLGEAKTKLATISAVEDRMGLMERSKASVPTEDNCKENLEQKQLVHPMESLSPPQMTTSQKLNLETLLVVNHVGLAARINGVAYSGGALGLVSRPHDRFSTELVMAAEAGNVNGAKNGMRLMKHSMSADTAPSDALVEGTIDSSQTIPTPEIRQATVASMHLMQRSKVAETALSATVVERILDPSEIISTPGGPQDKLSTPCPDLSDEAQEVQVMQPKYPSEMSTADKGPLDLVLIQHDPCVTKQVMAAEAKNLVAIADHMDEAMAAETQKLFVAEKYEVFQLAREELGGKTPHVPRKHKSSRRLVEITCRNNENVVHKGMRRKARPKDDVEQISAALTVTATAQLQSAKRVRRPYLKYDPDEWVA